MKTITKVLCFTVLLFVAGYDVVAAYKMGDTYNMGLSSLLLVILVLATVLSFGD